MYAPKGAKKLKILKKLNGKITRKIIKFEYLTLEADPILVSTDLECLSHVNRQKKRRLEAKTEALSL